MSGKVKHMQRSHYSHRGNKENVFSGCERRTIVKSNNKSVKHINRAVKKTGFGFINAVKSIIKKILYRVKRMFHSMALQ